MKTMARIQILFVVLLLLAAGGAAVWYYFLPSKSRVEMHDATLKEVKEIVRLCTVEIYEEVPVKGHVGSRNLVAREVLVGNISFDLDGLRLENNGDTVHVTLPREIVEVYESTGPESYTVIDTWNDNLFESANITTAEENRMKQLILEKFVKAVYAKGYVRRARAEAVANLTSLLSAFTGKTVVVTDPAPNGYQTAKRENNLPR